MLSLLHILIFFAGFILGGLCIFVVFVHHDGGELYIDEGKVYFFDWIYDPTDKRTLAVLTIKKDRKSDR